MNACVLTYPFSGSFLVLVVCLFVCLLLFCLFFKNKEAKLTSYLIYCTDTPISKTLQQTFLEHLLSTYRELGRSFMKKVYELYKAFQFRTLWEGNNPLSSFQRVASESARGTGRLNGAVQLTEVLRKTKDIQDKAMLCFTNNIYTTDIMKWSFDNFKDKEVSTCPVQCRKKIQVPLRTASLHIS